MTKIIAARPLVMTIAFLLCMGCNRPATPAQASVQEPDSTPKCKLTVYVTIDTLRADHLSTYGYFRETAPFLAECAARGVVFDKAYAPMGTTAPSHATMFTSLYPAQHGVTRNGQKLADSFTTLAEILKQNGMRTAAFTSSLHFSSYNVAQGFDVLNELADKERVYRPAGETVDEAIGWLKGQQTLDDMFVWVHVFDPHYPYEAPEEYGQALGGRSEERDLETAMFITQSHKSDWGFWRYKTDPLAKNILGYDSEIRYADAQLKRLLDYVHSRVAPEEALWIFTSDHGEGLGNHSYSPHGDRIYQEQLHVPLIYYWPGRLKASRVAQVVDHTDLLPTLLELRAIPLPDGLIAEGQSLVPALVRGTALPAKYAFGQRQSYTETGRTGNPFYEAGDRFSIQNESFKYVSWTEGYHEFYDLRNDPHELNNLLRLGGKEEVVLQQALSAKVKAMRRGAAPEAESVDEETKEMLRALGYVE